MVTWVVQSNKLKYSQTLPLIGVLKRHKIEYVDVAVNNRTRVINSPDVSADANLLPYGSVELTAFAHANKWKHVYFNESTFTAAEWTKHFTNCLNRDAVITTLSAAKKEIDVNEKYFIRPVKDLKESPGHVIDGKEFYEWVSRLEEGGYELSPLTEIVIAKPKTIQMEWRYFVVGGKVVTGSSYRYKGQPYLKQELDAAVLIEAQIFADIWLPHQCCCMDLALCDNELQLVEFNSINASGFYDNDIEAFALSLTKYAKEIENE
jgi:hypothetical protein